MPPRDTYYTTEDLATMTVTNTDQVATTTTVTTADAFEYLTDAVTTVGTTRLEPINIDWNNTWQVAWDEGVGRRINTRENEIQVLRRDISEVKEKFDAILRKLDQILGDKLVISDLDLARLLGLGEI